MVVAQYSFPLNYKSFFWLTLGLEPYSPHSQCGTLPVKLKPTFFVIETGFEPISLESKSNVLTIAPFNNFKRTFGRKKQQLFEELLLLFFIEPTQFFFIA